MLHQPDEKNEQPLDNKADCPEEPSEAEVKDQLSSPEKSEDDGSTNGEPDEEQVGHQEPTVEELVAQLEQMRAEIDDAKDKVLRAHAEAENVRRRSAREYENVRRFALESFARELLPAMDNFANAVKTAKEEEVSKSVIEGIELSIKTLADAMSKNGIQEFDPMGEVFDPERHMAMTSLEHPDAEPGTVIEVFRKGYLIHDRLLREAEVIVAKEMSAQANEDRSDGE